MTGPQFLRIYEIDKLIRAKKYPNARTLAERFEVSLRTAERDLALMKDLGAHLVYNHVRKGYEYEGDDFALPPLKLTQGELLAIFVGINVLGQYKGTTYEEPLRLAFQKMLVMLPDHVSVDFGSIDRSISFDIEPLRGDEQAVASRFEVLNRCINERRQVEMDYYTASRDERLVRKVGPLHLRYFSGAWYLIAYCHFREEVRVFALDRIYELRPLETGFAFPDGFSITEFLGDAWRIERGAAPVDVAIRFDRHQARWIREKTWHPSQKLEEEPDGSLLMRFRVGGLGEVRRWVMQFGAHAVVLEPPQLREDIARQVEGMTEIYGLNVARSDQPSSTTHPGPKLFRDLGMGRDPVSATDGD